MPLDSFLGNCRNRDQFRCELICKAELKKLNRLPRNHERGDAASRGPEINNDSVGPIKSGCQARLDRVKRYVESRISEPISLADLASEAALSPYHFSRAFKRCTGITPVRYILRRRVAAAKVMLTTGAMNAEIAHSCGFASESHFCTSFKLVTGMTATAWRKAMVKASIALGAAPNATELAMHFA